MERKYKLSLFNGIPALYCMSRVPDRLIPKGLSQFDLVSDPEELTMPYMIMLDHIEDPMYYHGSIIIHDTEIENFDGLDRGCSKITTYNIRSRIMLSIKQFLHMCKSLIVMNELLASTNTSAEKGDSYEIV